MREILFRGKRVDNEKWIEGSLVNNIFFRVSTSVWVTYIINPDEYEEYDGMEDIEVIPETVGQFTGLTDKNGVKIFEGDILCANSGREWDNGICIKYLQYAPVVYNPQKARFQISGKIGQSHKALNQVTNNYHATVVGNIHDNPELLP